MATSRKKITISIKENTYNELKEKNIKISTAINMLLEEFLRESS